VAEIDLRFLRDVISGIQVGTTGYAYVVGPQGQLLAQSSQLKAPRGTAMSGLAQVATILANAGDKSALWDYGRDLGGRSVLAAGAVIPRFKWFVIVEQPLSEAFGPVYAFLTRIGWLALLCIGLSALAGILFARHMVVPIRALHAGAARLGASEFGTRIVVHTGDEIEDLANEFNNMAQKLKDSYTRLERTSRSARAIWRGRCANSRHWRRSGARWRPHSTSRRCSPPSSIARSNSREPMRALFLPMTNRAASALLRQRRYQAHAPP